MYFESIWETMHFLYFGILLTYHEILLTYLWYTHNIHSKIKTLDVTCITFPLALRSLWKYIFVSDTRDYLPFHVWDNPLKFSSWLLSKWNHQLEFLHFPCLLLQRLLESNSTAKCHITGKCMITSQYLVWLR